MFRKFYTNASSLSYPFPPRSTVAGLVAGLLGYERDTYSEDLSLERFDVAVSVRVPVRRVMQTVNYVMTEGNVWAKKAGGFDGTAGGIPTPIEWVFPALGERELRYRIYVTHRDVPLVKRLSEVLRNGLWVYPPYLGMSECLGRVEHVATLEDWKLSARDDEIPVRTVVPSAAVWEGPRLVEGNQIVKERTPFALGMDRRLLAVGDVFYERNCNPVYARLARPIFEARYQDEDAELLELGVFLG